MSRRTLPSVSVLLLATLIAGCAGDPVTTPTDDTTAGGQMLDSRLTEVEAELEAVSAQLQVLTENMGAATPVAAKPGVVQATERSASGTVTVTVSGLQGYAGGDLAGVLQRDSDGAVVGGFGAAIEGADFSTSQQVRAADMTGSAGRWPPVTDEILVAEPGRYVLSLWADTGLGAYSTWFPLNTDGHGLIGCVLLIDVIDDLATSVTVDGDFAASGFGGVCNAPRGG